MIRRRVDPATAGALVVSALAAALLVTVGISHIIGYDSFWHVFVARQDRWPNFWREVGLNAHPPLYYLLLRAADWTFGHALLVYRLVSIAAIAASILLLARIVHRLSASSAVAIAAAAAFGLSFSAFEIGLEARAYALNLAWLLAAYLLFVEWLSPDTPPLPARKRWMFAAAASAALLTHYSAAFFVAGAFATVVLLAIGHRAWRRHLRIELTRHGIGTIAMFGVPMVIGAYAYAIHASDWAGRLHHVPAYMYYPTGESPSGFLGRALPTLATLFFPDTGVDLPFVPIVTAASATLALLGVRALRRGQANAVAFVMFASMLALNIAAALAGRYPLGGALRHESFLFPFLVIAVFVGLDATTRLVRLRGFPVAALVVAWLVIGSNAAAWLLRLRIDAATMMAGQVQAFRDSVGVVDAIAADQFNVIVVFAHYHDGEWRLHWEPPHGGSPQIWDVTRASERIMICRFPEWEADLSQPAFYRDVAACLEHSGAVRVGLFSPQQPQMGARRSTEIEDTAALHAAAAGLAIERLVIRGADISAVFRRAPDETGKQTPGETRIEDSRPPRR